MLLRSLPVSGVGLPSERSYHANYANATATPMIDLSAFHALAQTTLGPFAAKPTSLQAGQQEASKPLWTSPDGRVAIGIWECTPGRFTADRTKASEFCHFIFGTVEMTHADGSKVLLGAGDAITLPLGWTGEWHVLTQVRKLYVITQA